MMMSLYHDIELQYDPISIMLMAITGCQIHGTPKKNH